MDATEAITFSIRTHRRLVETLDAKALRADWTRNRLVNYLLAHALEQVTIPDAPQSPVPNHACSPARAHARRHAGHDPSEC